MTRTLNNPLRWVLAAGVLSLLLLATAGSASAATYPKAGGNSFTGGAEGWSAKSECSTIEVPIVGTVVCPHSSGYTSEVGNPPGSLNATGSTVLTVVGVFKTLATFESPSFTAGDGGGGSLGLQRGFFPGGLLSLTPSMTYTASLVDKTNGVTQKAIVETVAGKSEFAAKSGGVNLTAGHTYAVVIEAEFSASVAGLATSGEVAFDNVAVTGPGTNPGENGGTGGNGGNGGDGNGGEGGNGANGLTASRLEKLISGSLSGATLKGNKITVKDACPAAVGVACKTTLQGMLKKGKPATAKNVAKVPKGKAKRVSLRVKPKAKAAVAKKKKLLFKFTVKAGKVQVTVWKKLKLKHA